MKSIPISGKRGIGLFTIVDDSYYQELKRYTWHLDTKGYAVRWEQGNRKNRKQIYMHRFVNNTPSDLETDHIDRNKLNNQQINLRSVTHANNMRNIPVRAKSGFTGVDFKQNKWRAVVTFNKKQIHLGYFDTAEKASRSREEATKRYFS